jgi:UDP-2-acetamido-2,6-beta-L-arabino-hexul-4-ose reductase
VKLIYVGELVEHFIERIKYYSFTQSTTQSNTVNPSVQHSETIKVPHTSTIKVSKLLQKLKSYKNNYFEKGMIPSLDNTFNRNLWNTFLCYIDHKSFFPFHLKLNTDNRGSFVETVKLNSGGQVSFSTTVPGITRGNHFHTRKAERFAVIKGKARIELRRIGTDEVLRFDLDGDKPSFVDMPIWYTHNITNIGDEELYTIFWINEHFDPEDTDTYFEKV